MEILFRDDLVDSIRLEIRTCRARRAMAEPVMVLCGHANEHANEQLPLADVSL